MSRTRRSAGLVALAFLALHLPFLPASLEDLDSVNFALGVRDFDVAQHQPHPPGYPLYVLTAKGLSTVGLSELTALSLFSAMAGAASIMSFWALARALRPEEPASRALGAALLAAASPLFWVTAARPLSDTPGLAAAAAVQAMTLAAKTPAASIVAAFAAGLAAGLRSQIVWLTLPLLAVPLARLPGHMRTGTLAKMVAAYGLGAALWAVPLLALSGGPAAYLRTLASQGAEDFSGVAMLWTTRSVRALADALYFTFISPWGSEPLAVVMLFLAVLGALVAVWRGRAQMLALLALAFLPYLAFHLLFQETATTRYALPVVLPVALLIVQAGGLLPARAGQVAAGVLVAASLAVSVPQAFWYSRTEAPAFRMLEDMRRLSEGRDVLPVLAMHRRAEFDLRRPIRWIAGRTPAVERRLPSPPKHEWLEMVNYWNLGGRAPVWFVADPLRSDLALVDRRRIVRRYRWPSDLSAVLGGVRPNEMDWHVIDRPGWFAGAGWDLTPETAGVTREDGRGPGKSPIHAWIRRNPGGETTLMVGGRNHGGPAGRIQVTLDGRQIDSASVAPGFFLRMQALPSGALDGPGDYAMLTIAADTDLIAIEQFDAAPASEIVFGFGEGWHELEYSPRTGRMWRWSSDRAVVRVRARGRSLMLKLAGEVEAAGASNVVLRAGERTLVNQRVGRRFEIAASIPADAMAADEVALTLETSESYVPAEVGESGDRRRLGLKIYDFDLTPAF